jgi:chromosome segregation ATPase
MAAIEELERRVCTVEEELSGERHVSRYTVERATRNSEVLHSVRSEVGALTARVDHLGADMAAVKAALAIHGRALDVLQQDVRQIRGEVSEINRKLDILVAAATPQDPHQH